MTNSKCANWYCMRPIKIITPPIDKHGKRFCSELCRKVDNKEITFKQWEGLKNAAVQKSPAKN